MEQLHIQMTDKGAQQLVAHAVKSPWEDVWQIMDEITGRAAEVAALRARVAELEAEVEKARPKAVKAAA